MSSLEAKDTTVVVKGLKLHTRRRPGATKPPLLLIQGIGGSLEGWAPVLDAMPERDIVMVDSPGAGASQVPTFPIRMRHIADIIVGAAKSLGIAQADVLGYSMGGMVAQEVAHRHPRFTRKLILTGTSYGYMGAVPGHWSVYTELMSLKRYHDPEVAKRSLAKIGGGRISRDPEALRKVVEVREATAPTARGFYTQMSAVTGWTSRPWIRKLEMPTLVVHGDSDPIVPVVNGRKLARAIPHARLAVVPNAGHLMMFDDTDLAVAEIEPFLDS